MSVRPGNIDAGRRLAESLMVDQCAIARPGGTTYDGLTLTATSSPVYSGACRVRSPSLTEMVSIFGQAPITTTRFVVWVPWTAPRFRVGDVVTITESEDPTLLELALRVVSVPALTYVMRRKLGAEVIE